MKKIVLTKLNTSAKRQDVKTLVVYKCRCDEKMPTAGSFNAGETAQ